VGGGGHEEVWVGGEVERWVVCVCVRRGGGGGWGWGDTGRGGVQWPAMGVGITWSPANTRPSPKPIQPIRKQPSKAPHTQGKHTHTTNTPCPSDSPTLPHHAHASPCIPAHNGLATQWQPAHTTPTHHPPPPPHTHHRPHTPNSTPHHTTPIPHPHSSHITPRTTLLTPTHTTLHTHNTHSLPLTTPRITP
jgi:hypothetical protein